MNSSENHADSQKAAPSPVYSGESHDVSAMHAAIRREQSDPREGYEPISLWLVAFIGGLLFWGGYYFATFNAGFNPAILDTRRPTQVITAAPKAALTPEIIGQRTFVMACLPCHQGQGEGIPGQFPPLAGSEWVVQEDPGHIIRIILNGLQGPITVAGQQYNNVMPPWRDTLSDEQIAAVVTHIRNQWGNRASFVSVEQVAAIRAQVGNRETPWTAEELLAIPESP
jgi:mono/diheme cytochrome c family protein